MVKVNGTIVSESYGVAIGSNGIGPRPTRKAIASNRGTISHASCLLNLWLSSDIDGSDHCYHSHHAPE